MVEAVLVQLEHEDRGVVDALAGSGGHLSGTRDDSADVRHSERADERQMEAYGRLEGKLQLHHVAVDDLVVTIRIQRFDVPESVVAAGPRDHGLHGVSLPGPEGVV